MSSRKPTLKIVLRSCRAKARIATRRTVPEPRDGRSFDLVPMHISGLFLRLRMAARREHHGSATFARTGFAIGASVRWTIATNCARPRDRHLGRDCVQHYRLGEHLLGDCVLQLVSLYVQRLLTVLKTERACPRSHCLHLRRCEGIHLHLPVRFVTSSAVVAERCWSRAGS